MPHGYEVMRDSFKKKGLSDKAAKKKAAMIWNSKHKGNPVTRAKHEDFCNFMDEISLNLNHDTNKWIGPPTPLEKSIGRKNLPPISVSTKHSTSYNQDDKKITLNPSELKGDKEIFGDQKKSIEFSVAHELGHHIDNTKGGLKSVKQSSNQHPRDSFKDELRANREGEKLLAKHGQPPMEPKQKKASLATYHIDALKLSHPPSWPVGQKNPTPSKQVTNYRARLGRQGIPDLETLAWAKSDKEFDIKYAADKAEIAARKAEKNEDNETMGVGMITPESEKRYTAKDKPSAKPPKKSNYPMDPRGAVAGYDSGGRADEEVGGLVGTPGNEDNEQGVKGAATSSKDLRLHKFTVKPPAAPKALDRRHAEMQQFKRATELRKTGALFGKHEGVAKQPGPEHDDMFAALAARAETPIKNDNTVGVATGAALSAIRRKDAGETIRRETAKHKHEAFCKFMETYND
jgi:hypothetical protein